MKKFFNNIFGSKKQPAPQQNQRNQMQMPYQQNQMPMPFRSKHIKRESPKNYDLTNDPIPVTTKQPAKTDAPPITDPNKVISLKLSTDYSRLSKADYDKTNPKLPLLVTIETEDIDNDDTRQGIDLVLVIDVSSSMSGEKIKLVRETLVFVLDELETRDRVCMIKFDDSATQISGFKSMTDENKTKLKQLVEEEIHVRGCTDIRQAMNVAYSAMLSREEQNDSTAVFLLSDGADTCGNSAEAIKAEMKSGHAEMEKRGYKYQTHSFGYGGDHDEKVLSMISDTTSGNFYYIKTNQHVDECFIDCFGYLMSIIASQVQVNVSLQKGFKFSHLFSISWTGKGPKEAMLNLHGLAVGKTMEYITELSIDKGEVAFGVGNEVPVARALMSYMYDDKKFTIEQDLAIGFVEKDEEKGEADPQVRESYSKAEGTRVMERAKEFHERGEEKKARDEIKRYHEELEKDDFVSKEFKEKISKTVKIDFVRDNKDFMQVNKMMCENAYNPAYTNFSKMNLKQMRFMSKKKGY